MSACAWTENQNKIMSQKPAPAEGQKLRETTEKSTSNDAACYACLYCGSTDHTVDLDGMARVIVCRGCETRVPIAVMEDADLRPKCSHHKDHVTYLGSTSWSWCEKCGALGNCGDWEIPRHNDERMHHYQRGRASITGLMLE
jgi:hypothetical protein